MQVAGDRVMVSLRHRSTRPGCVAKDRAIYFTRLTAARAHGARVSPWRYPVRTCAALGRPETGAPAGRPFPASRATAYRRTSSAKSHALAQHQRVKAEPTRIMCNRTAAIVTREHRRWRCFEAKVMIIVFRPECCRASARVRCTAAHDCTSTRSRPPRLSVEYSTGCCCASTSCSRSKYHTRSRTSQAVLWLSTESARKAIQVAE